MSERVRVGLALGGGAFRGLAHIGVLDVLERNGISVDCVAGTSMGALVGAVYCCGMRPALLEKFCYSINEKDYYDVVLPKDGLLSGERAKLLVRTLTGGKTFAQAGVPFAAVATDLALGERKVFDQGLIYEAVRASISIPGVFKPAIIGGRQYVDGSVVDRVPTTTARAMGADVVISVDVGYHGGEVKCDNLTSILLHTFEVMEWQIMQHSINTSDITITPELQHINFASIAQAEETIRIGREEAERRLPDIQKAIEEFIKNKSAAGDSGA